LLTLRCLDCAQAAKEKRQKKFSTSVKVLSGAVLSVSLNLTDSIAVFKQKVYDEILKNDQKEKDLREKEAAKEEKEKARLASKAKPAAKEVKGGGAAQRPTTPSSAAAAASDEKKAGSSDDAQAQQARKSDMELLVAAQAVPGVTQQVQAVEKLIRLSLNGKEYLDDAALVNDIEEIDKASLRLNPELHVPFPVCFSSRPSLHAPAVAHRTRFSSCCRRSRRRAKGASCSPTDQSTQAAVMPSGLAAAELSACVLACRYVGEWALFSGEKRRHGRGVLKVGGGQSDSHLCCATVSLLCFLVLARIRCCALLIQSFCFACVACWCRSSLLRARHFDVSSGSPLPHCVFLIVSL
jgi:hypothetical protein